MRFHPLGDLLAALLSIVLLASTGQAETTANLLENPGAETGTTFPWNTDAEVQAGPLAIGTATLDATEGTRWFVTDKQIDIAEAPRPHLLTQSLSQVIDVRDLGRIESLTVRGDFFGAGEVLSGSASKLQWRVEINVYFYDEDDQLLDGAFFVSDSVPLAPLESFPDLSFPIASVPPETASASVDYMISLTAVIAPTDVLPLELRIASGMDDLVVTAEAVHNLLENPGAETGTTSPWGTNNGVQEGPLTLGEATLDASEGSYWFVADENFEITTVTSVGALIHYLTQTVDLRGLGTIESLTMQGDFFGAGEVLSGSASALGWKVEVFMSFLDEDEQLLDIASFGSEQVPLAPLHTFEDLVFTVDSVPAGTASVSLQYSGSLAAVTLPTDVLPVIVHIAIGIDDLVFSVTSVPEPTATGTAAAALAALGALRGRIRLAGRRPSVSGRA